MRRLKFDYVTFLAERLVDDDTMKALAQDLAAAERELAEVREEAKALEDLIEVNINRSILRHLKRTRQERDAIAAECAAICEREAERLDPKAAGGARHCATYIRTGRKESYRLLERLKTAEQERDAARAEAGRYREALDISANALANVFEAIDQGWWNIDHDIGCPEDDTCECNGGVKGTAGIANDALLKARAALAAAQGKEGSDDDVR